MLEWLVLATCSDPTVDPAAFEPVGLVVFGVIGLLGGAHCLGMCGPLVTTYAERLQATEGSARGDHLTLRHVRQHALFNLGRTTSYAILGGLFGLAGSLVFVTPRTVTAITTDVHAIAGIVVGTFIVAIGVSYLTDRRFLAAAGSVPGVEPFLGRVHRWLISHVDAWVADARIAGLGAAHGVLPCPLLYPAFLYAFVQGSPTRGFVSLAALGLGTVPSLFLYGTLFQSLRPEYRVTLNRVLGLAFVVLGYVPLQHGLALFGVPLPAIPLPYYQPL